MKYALVISTEEYHKLLGFTNIEQPYQEEGIAYTVELHDKFKLDITLTGHDSVYFS